MTNQSSLSQGLTRRQMIGACTMGAVSAAVQSATAAPAASFPSGFLWGAATAAHRVEGNNINSDLWVLEHFEAYDVPRSPPSDACDHYHRYADDIRMLARLGFNTYRFSIEWARIEPEPGFFSIAELDHYRRVLAACHENKLKPMVTFYHFTSPRWFAGMGGWENAASVDLFSRYCERASNHLGDMISCATTFNEPNVPSLLRWIEMDFSGGGVDVADMMRKAARAIGADRIRFILAGEPGCHARQHDRGPPSWNASP